MPVQLTTMENLMRGSLARQRLTTLLVVLFSAVALLLALVVLYGVVSYSVTQRGHEMSVRLALGARPAQVSRLVVGQGLRLALIGVAVGIALALALARVLSVMLYGVQAVDLPTFVAGSALLVAATAAASYVPARRAGRLDPMRALRSE